MSSIQANTGSQVVAEWTTFVDVARSHAARIADKRYAVWLDRGGEEVAGYTYGELDRRARALAAQLNTTDAKNLGELGAAKVSPAALIVTQPGLDFVVAFFACLYAGVAAVPVYPPRRGESEGRLAAIAKDSGARLILTDTRTSKLLGSFTSLSAIDRTLVVAESDIDFAGRWVAPKIDGNATAFIQYTSGSTGNPKGVVVTHANLLHNQRAIARAMGHDANTVVVSWLPMFHDMGLIGGLLQPFFLGAQNISMSPLDFVTKPILWLSAVSKYGATSSGAPNFGYEHCLSRTTKTQRKGLDLSSWRVAFNGAEPVNADTLEAFSDEFGDYGFSRKAWFTCYGMAESTLFVTGSTKERIPTVLEVDRDALKDNRVAVLRHGAVGEHRSGKSLSLAPSTVAKNDANAGDATTRIVSCGTSHGSADVRIVDEHSKTLCRDGHIGEIWVAGGSIASAYKNQPSLSTATFAARLSGCEEPVSSTPYLRTGDLGFLREGELYVVGRCKDLIIINGRNHHPQDIERTCIQCHPELRTAVAGAFGVPIAGIEKLVIVVSKKAVRELTLSSEEITTLVREAVVSGHGIGVHDVCITSQRLPVTSSGKLKRRACRDMFTSGSL